MSSHTREPIKHTCPDIDSAIRQCKDFYSDMESQLEDLRDSNDRLRMWGIEEADRVDELTGEVEELEQSLSDANDEIASLKKQIH